MGIRIVLFVGLFIASAFAEARQSSQQVCLKFFDDVQSYQDTQPSEFSRLLLRALNGAYHTSRSYGKRPGIRLNSLFNYFEIKGRFAALKPKNFDISILKITDAALQEKMFLLVTTDKITPDLIDSLKPYSIEQYGELIQIRVPISKRKKEPFKKIESEILKIFDLQAME